MTDSGKPTMALLVDRIRDLAGDEARRVSPPVTRWKVTTSDPLVIESLDEDVVLNEGDPDVEWSRELFSSRPDVGDVLLVYQDADTYVVGPMLDDAGENAPLLWVTKLAFDLAVAAIEAEIAALAAGGGDKHYEHTFGSATVWTVHHLLGKVPSWDAYDTSHRRIFGEFAIVDANTFTLTFNHAQAGTVYCN